MTTEVAAETAEKVADVVEDSIDGVVEVMEVVRNNPVTLALCTVVGVALGAAGGYLIASKKLADEFDRRLEEETEKQRQYFQGLYKVNEDGTILSPMDVLKERQPEAAEALLEYQGQGGAENPYEAEQDEQQIVKIQGKIQVDTPANDDSKAVERNVFDDPDWDYDEELKHRTKDRPYVISHDEFFEATNDYEQRSLTYFEVDDTLVDEADKPLDDVNNVIGDESLARFGHGSKEKNTVYVRNERLELDYEVTRSKGSYLEEVLGLEAKKDRELRHSADRRREFRRGED